MINCHRLIRTKCVTTSKNDVFYEIFPVTHFCQLWRKQMRQLLIWKKFFPRTRLKIKSIPWISLTKLYAFPSTFMLSILKNVCSSKKNMHAKGDASGLSPGKVPSV